VTSARPSNSPVQIPPEPPPAREESPAPPSSVPDASSTQTTKWGLPLAVVVVGMFMSVLDTSIVNVAIPRMQSEYGSSPDDIQWISTAYTLCLGVIVPTSAWLGERLGLKRLYLISLLGFALFSALCGTAGSLNMMVFYRILQAIPAGVIPVTCLTILYRMVPPDKLGSAMGLYGFGIVVAPGVGPAMGGYLVEYINWRLIFYINVPIGILGAIAAVVVLPKFPGAAGRKFDLPGFVCVAAGLFALLLAVSEGQQWGWTGYRVLILLAMSINLLALFVVIELQTEQPLLNVRVFAYWPFVNSLLLIAILTMGMFAVLYYVPLFLQDGQNITPMNTGLTVLPQAVAMVVIMPFAGRIYDRIGARWPAVIGLVVCAGGSLLMTRFNIDMSRLEVVEWTSVRASGVALAMMPIMTAGLSCLPPNVMNAGSAFNTLAQRVSSALGVAAMTALSTGEQAQQMADRSPMLSSTGPDVDPRVLAMQKQGPGGLISLWQQLGLEVEAQAYSNIFLVIGAFTIAGIVLALLLRGGRPQRSEGTEPIEIG
jgi:EmrB/QacA subfamily drug resistance transporter